MELRESILLIDDRADLLEALEKALVAELDDSSVDVRKWAPGEDSDDPFDEFQSHIDDATVLVVTDYDLTGGGMTGLFGTAIVGWCRQLAVPVGDFSRGNDAKLPKEPDLFELRVPIGEHDAAFIATMFRGFRQIRTKLAEGATEHVRSPSGAIASVVGRPMLEPQISLYMSRLASANSSLLDRLRSEPAPLSEVSKERLLAYVVGHLLWNAVLRFPGPILSKEALWAYLSTTSDEADTLCHIFDDVAYRGPFSSDGSHYWTADVDERIDALAPDFGSRLFESPAEYHKAVIEHHLDRELARHTCKRCGGQNGGYLCPFTARPVCDREDCSISANSWVPLGAYMSRVEVDFYEEWAPLVGF